jgi:hypothetical protein
MLSTQLIGCNIASLRSALLPIPYAASFCSTLVFPAVLNLSICCGYVDSCLYVHGKQLFSIGRIDQSSTRAWPQIHDMSNNDL